MPRKKKPKTEPCPICSSKSAEVTHLGVECPYKDIPNETGISFGAVPKEGDPPEEIIRFEDNGEVFVRGEKVDDNKMIYAVLKEFLLTGTGFETGFIEGYRTGRFDALVEVKRGESANRVEQPEVSGVRPEAEAPGD